MRADGQMLDKDDLSPGVRALLYWLTLMALLLGILLLWADDSEAADGPVTTPATPEANDPAYWGDSCAKFEGFSDEFSTFTASSSFSIVVLKSATTNDAWTNVAAGDQLTTSTGQAVSHIIKCTPVSETSPTPTPTLTPTSTPGLTPSVTPTPSPGTPTPTPTPSPSSDPTVTPTPSQTPEEPPTPTPTRVREATPTPTLHPSPTPTETSDEGAICGPGTLACTGPQASQGLLMLGGFSLICIGLTALIARRIWVMDHQD